MSRQGNFLSHCAPIGFVLAVCLLTGVSTTLAQAPFEGPAYQRGYSADQVYQFGDIDHVNLFNGNLSLTIPIGLSYAVGSRLSYQLVLTYNANLWDISTGCTSASGPGSNCFYSTEPSQGFNAGAGWSLSYGRLLKPNTKINMSGDWLFISADAASHRFFSTLHPSESAFSDVFYTRDGSYLRMKKVASRKREVEMPDGTVRRFEKPTADDSEWLLTEIRDRFGNFVRIEYLDGTTETLDNWNKWRVFDSTGREHSVEFIITNHRHYPKRVNKVKLARFGTVNPAIYDFNYHQQTIGNACPLDFPTPDPLESSQLWFLDEVVLPDNDDSRFSFAYIEASQQVCRIDSGSIKKLTLPTLGKLAWTYHGNQFPRPNPPYPNDEWWLYDTVIGVATRKELDKSGAALGTWGYQSSLTPNGGSLENEAITTVTDPLGHVTKHYFSVDHESLSTSEGWTLDEYGLPFTRGRPKAGNLFLSTQVFDASDLASPIRSNYVRYEQDSSDYATLRLAQNSNRRPVKSRTVYRDDGDRYAQTTYSDFDGLGHYRTMTTGGNFPRGNTREEITRYNPERNTYGQNNFKMLPVGSPWILGTYDLKSQTEDGVTAKQDYCFTPSTGLLKRQRIRKATSRGSHDLLQVFNDDDSDGNVDRERYFGGDTGSISTSGEICDFRLPTDHTYRVDHTYAHGVRNSSTYKKANNSSIGFKSLDLDIDANTGLPIRSRDTAGLRTTYKYDAIGRPTFVKPQAGEGAWTQYDYTAATASALARVKILTRPNGGGGAITQSEVYYDDLGRVYRERKLMPTEDWSQRKTQYNANGWKRTVSEWTEPLLGTTHVTKYLDYDPFGRPNKIVPPDGSAHKVLINYRGDSEIKRTVKIALSHNGANPVETSTPTWEQYDRQGRLWQVTEKSGEGGSNVDTIYAYDVGNRLREAKTAATVAGQTITQKRIFTYDKRGFLREERHPEKGANGNGYVQYSNYDARGHVGRRIDGPFSLDFSYDRAERLTRVQETSGNQRVLKEFDFDNNGTGPGAWSLGKLESAFRRNDLQAQLGSDIDVTETYTYNGLGGRVSQRETLLQPHGGSLKEKFEQSLSYDDLGNLSTQTYPECTHSKCTDDNPPDPPTITYGYTRGLLSSVPGWADSISYHRNGMINRVVHSNGVSDLQVIDPDFMSRPRRIQTKNVDGNNIDSGTFLYDGAGNVAERGQNWFVYDKVGRVVEGTARKSGGFLRKQNYTYDAFGNRLTASTKEGANGTSVPSFHLDTESATNRLADVDPGWTVTYDAAGNLTRWGNYESDYDGFNMVARYYGGGIDQVQIYTADDERIALVDLAASPATTTYRVRDLGGRVLREYVKTGNTWEWTEDYVYRDGKLLGTKKSQGGKRHFHLDHLGSPRAITQQNRQFAAKHVYYPFGEEASDPNKDDEMMKFTGHERDLLSDDTTLDDVDYMHARYYSPVMGRFGSVDPVGGSPAKPQSWNRYSYVQNQPVNYKDPSGQYREDFHRDLTNALAIAAGYSIEDATAIADATQAIDEGRTGPFRSPLSRAAFHFTGSRRRSVLLGIAKVTKSDFFRGAYIHSLQDSFSHHGFGSLLGHVDITALGRSAIRGNVIGVFETISKDWAVDSTASRPGLALAAARSTFGALVELDGGNSQLVFEAIEDAVWEYLTREEGDPRRQEALMSIANQKETE